MDSPRKPRAPSIQPHRGTLSHGTLHHQVNMHCPQWRSPAYSDQPPKYDSFGELEVAFCFVSLIYNIIALNKKNNGGKMATRRLLSWTSAQYLNSIALSSGYFKVQHARCQEKL